MKTFMLKLELADRRGISIRDRDSMLLAEAEKSISREVSVPGDMTLYGLHLLIQRAFGWKNIHLHKFKLKDRDFDKLYGGCIETVLKLCGVLIRPKSEDGFEWHRHELVRSGIFTEDILMEDSFYLNKIMAEGLRESFEKCRAGYDSGKRERMLTGCNRLLERLRVEEVFKEEEMLNSSNLEPPQVTRLLKRAGITDPVAIDVDEAMQLLSTMDLKKEA